MIRLLSESYKYAVNVYYKAYSRMVDFEEILFKYLYKRAIRYD